MTRKHDLKNHTLSPERNKTQTSNFILLFSSQDSCFFEVKILGQIYDFEKVILAKRSKIHFLKGRASHERQCLSYINTYILNKKVTAILNFGGGLETEQSSQPQILVLAISYR
jgi:hypothetical protein